MKNWVGPTRPLRISEKKRKARKGGIPGEAREANHYHKGNCGLSTGTFKKVDDAVVLGGGGGGKEELRAQWRGLGKVFKHKGPGCRLRKGTTKKNGV